MKRVLTFGIVLMLSLAATAQNNITKFLGIPIDGTKTAMIQKLKTKGFTYNAKDDFLSGQFNGRNVNLHVITNNNKVYRIVVTDEKGSSESEIKIRFNTLCNQFMKNGKYLPQDLLGEYTLGEDVDIAYDIIVNKKRFQAAYYQVSEADQDTTGASAWILNRIQEDYGEEGWGKMNDEDRNTAILSIAMDYLIEKVSHKSVWFMINEIFGSYYISIFYDNVKNQANGEDL